MSTTAMRRGSSTAARAIRVVFVHNAGLSHRLWDYQMAHFKPSRRVVAPDLLGYGESDRPEIVYTAEDSVVQLEHLVDDLGFERFDLVGCCLGGGVSLEFPKTAATC